MNLQIFAKLLISIVYPELQNVGSCNLHITHEYITYYHKSISYIIILCNRYNQILLKSRLHLTDITCLCLPIPITILLAVRYNGVSK